MFLNGSKVIAEVSMASVNLPSLYKTIRVKHLKPDNLTDYNNPFYMNDDKQKNREIMDGDWIFSNKGIHPNELEKEVKQMYKELMKNDSNPNKLVAVQNQDQADFLKKCEIPVLVLSGLPDTIDLIFTTTSYEPPKRKHTCRNKRIYCSQTDAWIKARYIQNLVKEKKEKIRNRKH